MDNYEDENYSQSERDELERMGQRAWTRGGCNFDNPDDLDWWD